LPLYLYAIAPAKLPRLRVRGFDGAIVRRVRVDEILAMVSEIDAAPPLTEESLRMHQDVIDRLFAVVTILPIRFGTLLADTSGAVRMLRERKDVFSRTLAHLAGKAEISVKAAWDEFEPVPTPHGAKSGRGFLAKRLEVLAAVRAYQERATEAGREIHHLLSTKALAGVTTVGRANQFFNGDYLVRAKTPAPFLRICEEARERWQNYSFSVTGPWPPAAFAARLTRVESRTDGQDLCTGNFWQLLTPKSNFM